MSPRIQHTGSMQPFSKTTCALQLGLLHPRPIPFATRGCPLNVTKRNLGARLLAGIAMGSNGGKYTYGNGISEDILTFRSSDPRFLM